MSDAKNVGVTLATSAVFILMFGFGFGEKALITAVGICIGFQFTIGIGICIGAYFAQSETDE